MDAVGRRMHVTDMEACDIPPVIRNVLVESEDEGISQRHEDEERHHYKDNLYPSAPVSERGHRPERSTAAKRSR